MKQFIKRLIIFLLLPFTIFCSVEIMFQMLPNDYKLKRDYIQKNKDKIENLILGSSHTFKGIDPQYLSPNSFNLAYSGQSLIFDEMLLKKYFTSSKNLKRIIIPISYMTFREMDNQGLSSPRRYDYLRYHGIGRDNISIFDIDSYLITPNKGMKQVYYLLKVFLRKGTLVTSDSLGLEVNYRKECNDFQQDALDAFADHSKGKAISDSNIKSLNRIIEFAKENDIDVVLTRTPKTKEYLDLLDEEYIKDIKLIVNNLVDKNNNVMFYDYSQDSNFTHKHFYDSNHLNTEGAKIFSKLLWDRINS